ncbi:MAG: 2-oxo acid dehydrogenase subunit E2 [Caldilineaceae bacterium]
MASEILMPRLGWTMEEGTFGQWLKQDGASVKTGDLLFTVESDKATQEVEAFDHGILRIPPDGPQPGEILPVGALMAFIVQPGETAPFEAAKPVTPAATPAPATESIPTPQAVAVQTNGASAESKIQSPKSKINISPRARRVAGELGVDWTQLPGSGATGRIIERDIRAAAEKAAAEAAAAQAAPPEPAPQEPAQETKVRATPVAARLAQQAGIDLVELAAQQPGKRIEREDVEAVIAARATGAPQPVTPEPATPPATPPSAPVTGERVPVSRIRRIIAQRMAESSQTTAPVTLTTEVDATEFVALREQLKATFTPRGLPVPSYNDLLIKLTAVALQEHRLLNATWTDNEIVIPAEIHIGLAVDVEEGLLVPVVRDVQAKNVRQIAVETKALIEKAKTRKLSAEELQGGTFTITNLGMYGIDAFTPIINLPQCAILGVGRIVKKPAVYQDQIVPRQMMALSLTHDHRVVDGAPAARFLNTVREYIETPTLWLVG